MDRRRLVTLLSMLALLIAAGRATAQEGGPGQPEAGQAALGSGFTYQGQLRNSAGAVSGGCGFQFGLWDAAAGGVQSGITQTVSGVSVSGGLFTALLNGGGEFGPAAFDGTARWLGLAVRCPDSGLYTPLSPRQALTASPYALYALGAGAAPWAGLSGVPAGFADNTDNDTTYGAGAGLTLVGATFAISSTYRLPQGCAAGKIAEWTGSLWACADDATGGDHWSLAGNIGTTSANFLGTTDNMTLTFRVNGATALRLVPSGGVPNVLGGGTGNVAGDGIQGATVGGGNANSAGGYWTTVGGGTGNNAGGTGATVTGGLNNTASGNASIAGGQYNTASGFVAAALGGGANLASGAGAVATGGEFNAVSGDYANSGGGYGNMAGGHGATVGGGGYDGAATSGNQALAAASTIGGGYGNVISATATYGTVGGGNANLAAGIGATVGGGGYLSGFSAGNEALGAGSTVGGGVGNDALGDLATVAGGYLNTAGNTSGGSSYPTVGGGYLNIAVGNGATVGGGYSNQASEQFATVAGGFDNTASVLDATVAGGQGNTASGGWAAVGGGQSNVASQNYATVPGGFHNTAGGQFSLAAGRLAAAMHDGAFVWADSTGAGISSTIADQFLVRASGGVTLYTNSGATIGATLLPGASAWTIASDRNLKANFVPVDSVAILDALMGIPIETWNYNTQDAGIRHIGPMAQDFHAAFAVGETETGISTVDADGVALAAIQGLYTVVQAKDAALAEQGARLAALEGRLAVLEQGQATPPPAPGGYGPLLVGLLLGAALALGVPAVAARWRALARGQAR